MANRELSSAASDARYTWLLKRFHSQEVQVVLRLCVAAIAGSIIGLERRTASRPAGIRTMALVSLGAATFTLVSIYGFVHGDTSRLAAQVASGVGFIGAGVIGSGGTDRAAMGLLTASAIWVAAAVGVASGTGMLGLALFGSILTVLVLRGGKMKTLLPPYHLRMAQPRRSRAPMDSQRSSGSADTNDGET